MTGDPHVPEGDVTWKSLVCRCGHVADRHMKVPPKTPSPCFDCACVDWNWVQAWVGPESTRDKSGDWPEDLTHENGNYRNVCGRCGRTFQGHKRRVRCKVCDEETLVGHVSDVGVKAKP